MVDLRMCSDDKGLGEALREKTMVWQVSNSAEGTFKQEEQRINEGKNSRPVECCS